jgi:hypothetical protein
MIRKAGRRLFSAIARVDLAPRWAASAAERDSAEAVLVAARERDGTCALEYRRMGAVGARAEKARLQVHHAVASAAHRHGPVDPFNVRNRSNQQPLSSGGW